MELVEVSAAEGSLPDFRFSNFVSSALRTRGMA